MIDNRFCIPQTKQFGGMYNVGLVLPLDKQNAYCYLIQHHISTCITGFCENKSQLLSEQFFS